MNRGRHLQGAQRPTLRLRVGVRVTLFFVGALMTAAVPAAAYVTIGVTTTNSYSAATANALNGGNTPSSGSVNGENVTINWAQSTMAHGAQTATGYTIKRYSSATGGTAIPATGGCAGTVAALTCTEQNVPPGNWWYTVTPVYDSWTGAESGRLAVTVTAPSFSITSGQSVASASGGSITGGALAHFGNTENVTFHLDTAGGTTLTTSPSTVTTSGTGSASTFTVNIPSGTGPGNHSIVAVGATSGLAATSNTFSVYGTLSQLVLAAQTTTPTAGAPDNLTITAEDSGGNTVTSYTGSHTLSFIGASSIGSFNPTVTNTSGTATAFNATPNTAITFTGGVATVSGSSNGQMVLYKSESASIVVSDGTVNNGTGLPVTVSPKAADSGGKLTLAAQTTTPTADAGDNLTITAFDQYGNQDTNYTGSHNLTFTGANLSPNNTNPTVTNNSSTTAINFGSTTAITFASGVASPSTTGATGQAVMILYKAETTSIVVSDGTINNGSGLSVTVKTSIASNLAYTGSTYNGGSVNCTFGCSETGNSPTFVSSVSVTDHWGNIISNLGTTVTVTLTKGGGAAGTLTPTSLTIPPSGAATSTGTFSWSIGNGNFTTSTVTASGGSFTSVVVTLIH